MGKTEKHIYKVGRCSIMAVHNLPKVRAWVRFPSPAQVGTRVPCPTAGGDSRIPLKVSDSSVRADRHRSLGSKLPV